MLLAIVAAGAAAGQGDAPQAGSGPAPSKDALFQKVFGQRKASKPRLLDLPVRFDGRELGLIKGRLAGDPKDTAVDVGQLTALLADVAQEQPLAALRELADPDGFALVAAFPPDGIVVQVDAADLSVKVSVPAALRRIIVLDVQGRPSLAKGFMALPAADLSAYINARAALEYLSLPDPGRPDGRGPLRVVFEQAVNFKGWVVEAEGFYREDGDRRWSRGPVRLIRDLPDSALRLQAGDLSYPVAGMQVGRAMAGLALSRNFGLQPYRATQPAGQRDFILETPSIVEVYVNGRPTRTFRLEPGPYNLNNFPGTSGTNDIQIRITDVYGRQQVVEFPFFFDSQLLATGVHEFSYALGYPSQSDSDRILYDNDRLTLSGFHRLGVTDRLTLGANIQADRLQRNVGAEVLWTTALGTFGLEPAASFAGANGYAVNLRYRDYRTGETLWRQRSVTAQVGWRDSAFTSFGTLDPRNDVSFDASFRISQPLMQNLTTTLGARWRESRNPERADSYSVDLSLRRRLGRTGSVDLTLSGDRDTEGVSNLGAFFSMRFNFDGGRQSAGFAIDTDDREQRLDWRFQSLYPVDQWSLSLDATHRAGQVRLQGGAGYVHQRFLASARHDLVERSLSGERQYENRTQVNLSTGLVFADGHVAVTRPVSNSFAIVVPHPRLKDRTVGVDPINGKYLASNDFLGPPVVPNISPYLIRPLLLDVPDTPVGYDIGEDRPAVVPGYKSGTLVPIGTDATVSLDGSLVQADGTPASLLSGVLRPAEGPGKEMQFFTNRKGRFRVEGIRPGRWILSLYGIDARPVPVDIPSDAEGVIKLGEIRISPP